MRSNTEDHDFDEAFRRWAARLPVASPANAARATLARLQAKGVGRQAAGGLAAPTPTGEPGLATPKPIGEGGRRQAVRVSPAWATLAIAIIVLVAGTASFIHTLPPVSPIPARGNAARPSPVPAREADVLLWLDDGTPVYVFLPDGS